MPDVRLATDADIPSLRKAARLALEEIGYLPTAIIREGVAKGRFLFHEDSGAFCHFRTRKDGVSVIYEIAVPIRWRGKGIGRELVSQVPTPIQLKCPFDNESNRFYESIGFQLLKVEHGKKRKLCVWYLEKR